MTTNDTIIDGEPVTGKAKVEDAIQEKKKVLLSSLTSPKH